MSITIAGAGIGGLTAALSLHAAGFDAFKQCLNANQTSNSGRKRTVSGSTNKRARLQPRSQ
jgi:2-polyprenyl-6-methoxyphenol hydroxylase-like FAD-dependent oxidoreductase